MNTPEPATLQPQHVELVALGDTAGRLWYIARPALEALQAAGVHELSVVIPIPPPAPEPEGLTVTEAARAHLDDVDGRSLKVATAHISLACNRGHIRCSGSGRERRIDPDSFASWRLRQRERNLDREDA